MATTTYGTPYVANTDLVSAWPGVSLNVAQRVDSVSYAGNGINAQTGTTYTLVLTDAGKNVTTSNASAVTVTIPTNASVAFPTGTVISITNLGAGVTTVAASGGVTLSGTTLTIAQYNRSSIMKTATDTWVLTSGGGIPKAVVSSTTGSPTIIPVGTQNAYKYTGTGTVVIGTAGTLTALIVAGGGGSGSGTPGGADPGRGTGGGGGAGGYIYQTIYLAAGTYACTVGSGGAAFTVGQGSALGNLIFAPGGGLGRTGAGGAGGDGGSGGGAGGNTTAANGGITLSNFWGYSGGANGSSARAGGGGGSSAVGATGGAGGAGGAGTANTITGSSVTYAAGGSSLAFGTTTNGTAGDANTGNGAGGASANASTGGTGAAGGSGVVILLIG